jgi:hypothetical protein
MPLKRLITEISVEVTVSHQPGPFLLEFISVLVQDSFVSKVTEFSVAVIFQSE